jgi:hypothetical protein
VGLIGNQAKLCGNLIGSWPQTARSRLLPSCLPQIGRLMVLLALAASAAPSSGWSQQVLSQQAGTAAQGSIHGTVVGRDGAVLEGANISLSLTDSDDQPAKSIQSDSNGQFNFAAVSPGGFKLTVSCNGFVTQIASGVLHAGESLEEPAIELLLASTASEVRVTASQAEIAQEQLKVEETQRIFGVIPNYYISYAPNPVPLTSKQKFELAWKTSIDPVSFLSAGASAGIQQSQNTFSGYGQGAAGYGKRFGANFANNSIGNFIGAAMLTSVFKQDPRYFYKGTGTTKSRILYAIAASVICKGDNGHWQPAYAAILGGLAAGGISNLYYPASDRVGVKLTFENALIGTAGSAAQNIFQEFFVRRLTPKLPKNGATQP